MSALSVFAAAAEQPEALALVVPSRGLALSYAALAARVAGTQRALAARALPPGAPLAFVPHAELESLVLLLALFEAGHPVVPVHPRLVATERARLLASLASPPCLADDEVTALGSAPPSAVPPRPAQHEPELPLAIVPTSGTSGAPKGVLLSRRAFVASARASAAHLGYLPRDRWLLGLPLAHVGGLSVLTRSVLARRTVVLVPRFEPELVLAALVAEEVTLLSAVPTMLAALLSADRDNALARLRVLLLGGAAAPQPLVEEAISRGIPVLPTYGLTEACSQVATQPLRRPLVARSGVGRPLPGVLLEVRNAAGAVAAPGEEGRIFVGGEVLFSGYAGEPPRAEGLFETGDLGHLDGEGSLHVSGRRTDLVVTGGENVRPQEVEGVLTTFPGIAAALVFGLEDPRWGQLVAAALVLAPGASLDEGALARHLEEQLAPHKRPRRMAIVEALPSTPLGKPDRRGAAARLAGVLRVAPRR